MGERRQFLAKVRNTLEQIDAQSLAYDESEYWMIRRPYEYIEYYANDNLLFNTAIALPLARGLHDGSHRKSKMMKNGISYRMPYVIHCLLVCRMLVDLHVPLSKHEEDIMLAASLCHDMIEDLPFPDHGRELFTMYHLDPEVYDIVKILSKRDDYTQEEHLAYFDRIKNNRIALMIKLSDRGHNVEDLYNMSIWKTHEYVEETRIHFFPMCVYGKENYPELYMSFEVLQDKIVSLTQVAEILVNRYEEMEKDLLDKIKVKQEENDALRKTLKELEILRS